MVEFVQSLIGVFQGFNYVLKAFSVLSYLLMAWGLYGIAKRRGISNPWVAWIPVLQLWILGSISDHYQRQVHQHRRIMCWLLICLNVLVSVADSMMSKTFWAAALEAFQTEDLLAIFEPFLIWLLALSVLSLILAVLRYFALYDLYKSCVPDKSLVFLLLSIFVGITQPFLVFFCRKKDLGLCQPEVI